MNSFIVYGVPLDFKPGGTIATNNVPFDINIPNLYGRPDGWPEDVLIVGASQTKEHEGENEDILHCIESQHHVRVASKKNFKCALRQYQAVEDWLHSEVDIALET